MADNSYHYDSTCDEERDMYDDPGDVTDSDSLQQDELEALLYSQIYFDHNEEVLPGSPQAPEISVEEISVTGGGTDVAHAEDRFKSPVASMLNYNGRAFLCTPEGSVQQGPTGNARKRHNEPDEPEVLEGSSSETVSEVAVRIKKKRKNKDSVVVLSDSDFEIEKSEKKYPQKLKKKAKKRPNAGEGEGEVKKKKTGVRVTDSKEESPESKVITVESSDSDNDVICLDDSGVLADQDDINVHLSGAARGKPTYHSSTALGNDLNTIDLAKWDGNPPLTLTEVHQLLKPCDWSIGHSDIYRSYTSNTKRYYNQRAVECNNCRQRGHTARDCKAPKRVVCIHCGEHGHKSWECPHSLCYNCDMPGHKLKQCNRPRKSYNVTCARCSITGHFKRDCRELWRQYHMTTTEGALREVEQEENRRPYCYNCARKGHFGHECSRQGFDEYWNPAAPFVTYYDLVKESFVQGRKTGEDWTSNREGRNSSHTWPDKAKNEIQRSLGKGSRNEKCNEEAEDVILLDDCKNRKNKKRQEKLKKKKNKKIHNKNRESSDPKRKTEKSKNVRHNVPQISDTPDCGYVESNIDIMKSKKKEGKLDDKHPKFVENNAPTIFDTPDSGFVENIDSMKSKKRKERELDGNKLKHVDPDRIFDKPVKSHKLSFVEKQLDKTLSNSVVNNTKDKSTFSKKQSKEEDKKLTSPKKAKKSSFWKKRFDKPFSENSENSNKSIFSKKKSKGDDSPTKSGKSTSWTKRFDKSNGQDMLIKSTKWIKSTFRKKRLDEPNVQIKESVSLDLPSSDRRVNHPNRTQNLQTLNGKKSKRGFVVNL